MEQYRLVLILFGALVLISLGFFLVSRFKGNSQSIKQRWGATINIGAYPPSVDPTYYTRHGTNWNFSPTADMTAAQAAAPFAKWNNFINSVPASISGTVYSLFPDLQTPQAVENYGLTDRMVYVLSRISDLLDNPSQYKTPADVQQAFAPIAINVFDMELDEVPQSGLYRNWKRMDWGVDVL
jgi:hypothetical protein